MAENAPEARQGVVRSAAGKWQWWLQCAVQVAIVVCLVNLTINGIVVSSLPGVYVERVGWLPSVDVGRLPSVEVSSLPSVEVSSLPSVRVYSLPSVEVSSLPWVDVNRLPSVYVEGVGSLPSVMPGIVSVDVHVKTLPEPIRVWTR